MRHHTVKIGKTHKLTAKWSSANKDVATVDSEGVVTAVGTGTAEIYCTIGDVSAAAVVTVPPATPK